MSWIRASCAAAAVLVSATFADAGFLLNSAGNGSLRNYNPSASNNFTGQIGAYFQAVSSVDVTALGFWDGPDWTPGSIGDGLLTAHTVSLFQQTGASTWNLIAQAVVPSGTSGTLINEFRYVSLSSSASIVAGQKYAVLATVTAPTAGTPPVLQDAFRDLFSTTGGYTPPSLDSAFAMLGRAFTSNLTGPPTTYLTAPGTSSYVGPNLQFAAAVPEPGSMAIFALGAACVAGMKIRRRE
jgi:hypothetical protein